MTSDELSDLPVIIVATGPASLGPACNAVLGAGATPMAVDPDGAAAAMKDHPRVAGVIVEVDDGAIARDLPSAIVAAGRAAGVPTIVLLDTPHLDAIGADLLARDVTLLCDATPYDLAGAVAVLLADGAPVVRDGAREAARLQQLNAEVARFAATLAKLAGQGDDQDGGLVEATPFVAERGGDYGAQPAADIAPAEIRRAIRARRLRDDAFGIAGLFEEPAWDILLDLFAAELERRRVSVSSLCIAAAVAPTTALRWIGKLIDAGLLDRRPDDFDRRRAYISLSARASTAMRNHLANLRRAGLVLG